MGARSFMVRGPTATILENAATDLSGILAAAKALWPNTVTFSDAVVYEVGDTFSNPIAWTPQTGSGLTGITAENYPRFISMVGRGVLGRRTRLYLYGLENASPTADYRLSTDQSGPLGTLRVNLMSLYQSVPLTDISKSPVTWKPYWNVGYNAYYQRKARG
jgi:hypothetical protein